jgi:hypothetical protein
VEAWAGTRRQVGVVPGSRLTVVAAAVGVAEAHWLVAAAAHWLVAAAARWLVAAAVAARRLAAAAVTTTEARAWTSVGAVAAATGAEASVGKTRA